jgi:DNA sulfur modification protein DndD
MRLRRLTLKNFGLYRGEATFDLLPRTKWGKPRPIVLVGGHNGAGKTTVLEALRLCLYGRLALGDRVREIDYQQYLKDRVHRDPEALIPTTHASVMLEFEYARSGGRAIYTVERSWETSKAKVEEDLTVLVDGKPYDDVESLYWSDFLRSLVPPGLSQLFFFDGEKIQKLAEDDSDAASLADSVKALLGLDLVERLQADLDLYAARESKDGDAAGDATRLEEVDSRIKALNDSIQQLAQSEAGPRTQLEYVKKEITRLEQLLVVEGHGLAARQGELRERKSAIEADIDSTARRLRELCDGALPFAACPKLAGELLDHLSKEEQLERWSIAATEVEACFQKITRHLTNGPLPKRLHWDSETRGTVKESLLSLMAEHTTRPKALATFTVLHGLSTAERDFARKTITVGLEHHARESASGCTELTRLEDQLRKLQSLLNRAPDEEDTSRSYKKLSDLRAQEIQLSVELANKERETNDARLELAKMSREAARIQGRIADSARVGSRVHTAVRVRSALVDYLDRLTRSKVSQLETATMDCFRQLMRKTDLTRAIHIDPLSFEVSLTDGSGHRIPKKELSAGEKQIYAISVLWALARVSGRPLPMIIDTPLARLDSIHRQKLVDSYFPAASHQVVILSTDTEVDAACYDGLEKHISHAIQIVNHGDWSEAQDGYFWNRGKETPRAAASA